MALTPSQRKANDKYIKEHYSQVKLSMPNQEAEDLTRFCEDHGYTKAGFIREAIKEKMERATQTVSTDAADTVPTWNSRDDKFRWENGDVETMSSEEWEQNQKR